ncbi:uncharacterized protein K460DRAFT_368431 [Cucurbitaria berberidis CBS 394.84]|uniref:Uncharacterized protein n=1 Tax=Cucurbitaria berberidis CBS 394.84 TaxID=1168544 RepID=A0A9P4GDC3_9PLEO|nr:uncharacterized protein K460DRAFT_368431 [Cucurbitaria berberidis CBS 394.84]KAF1843542.1 hypothetical protein K460DRAFT_368431 [Cucurbitaria berberidis CBS 394.84]
MTNTLEPPAAASQTYTALFNTALNFIDAQTQDPNLPSRMDFDRIRALCSPGFEHSWGHNYAVSLAPPLQGSHSVDGFISHLQKMLPNLDSWNTDVMDAIVDEARLRVILRMSLWMQVKGVGEGDAVENDILWVLDMDGDLEKLRVKKSMEFIDGLAAGRIKELMMRKM